MNFTGFNININTHQLDTMTEFYGGTLGLQRDPYSGGFEVGSGSHLHLDAHSEITQATSEPARVLVNFLVDDAKAEREALEAKGVEFIRKEGTQEWGGTISTFLDPDGNYLQFIEFHEPSADGNAPS